MEVNPYEPPNIEPQPRAGWRKLVSLWIKVLSVPIGLFVGAIGTEAGFSVLHLALPRFGAWLLAPGFGIGIAAGLAAAAYCFRIANAIHPKRATEPSSN